MYRARMIFKHPDNTIETIIIAVMRYLIVHQYASFGYVVVMVIIYSEVVDLFSTNIHMYLRDLQRSIAFCLAYIPFYQIFGFHPAFAANIKRMRPRCFNQRAVLIG